MFKPPYWNHKNIKFPKEEIDIVIKQLKDLPSKKYKNFTSLHYRDNNPEKIWSEVYSLILSDLLTDVGIYKMSKYSYVFWSQYYTQNSSHNIHNHYCPYPKNDISFVHFLKVTDTPLFRFTNLEGEYFTPPKQNEGDFICFPSWVWHEVIPNESNQERLVVAGNIQINNMDVYQHDCPK
tara:strand:+ start:1334 stop:1870 length:537 start_codon:yes stop_codon:yes gene_type:complete